MQSSSKSRNSGELWWPPGSSSCVISWLNLKGADSCIKILHTIDTCTCLCSNFLLECLGDPGPPCSLVVELVVGRAMRWPGNTGKEVLGNAHKAEVAAGADLQDEAEVDVHQVADLVDHDVAIVPVLDVQQVARDRIPAHVHVH
jgi:hypothetical protein